MTEKLTFEAVLILRMLKRSMAFIDELYVCLADMEKALVTA